MKEKKEKKQESPIFYETADGLWHYQCRCLTTDLRLIFQVSKEGYDTPEDAMRSYLEDAETFQQKIKLFKDKQPGNTSFRQELLAWYHNIHLAVISGSTVVTSSYVLYHFILPNLGALGDKKLDQITAKELDKLIQSLNQCCDTAQAQAYKFLNIFFKEMYLDQKIWANPMELATPYYFASKRKEVPNYTKKELAALLASARKGMHFFEVYLMLLGLRTGEIRGLKESDFNEEKGIIHIRRQIVSQDEVVYSAGGQVKVKKAGITVKAPKTESSNRIIRVPAITFDLLWERKVWLEETKKMKTEKGRYWDNVFAGYICRSDTGRIKSESTFIQALKRICSSAKIPIVSPHDLRHIAATLMFEYSLSNTAQPSEEILKTVSEYLGHSSTNTTFDIYMDYVRDLSRVRQVSEELIDPFHKLPSLEGRACQ